MCWWEQRKRGKRITTLIHAPGWIRTTGAPRSARNTGNVVGVSCTAPRGICAQQKKSVLHWGLCRVHTKDGLGHHAGVQFRFDPYVCVEKSVFFHLYAGMLGWSKNAEPFSLPSTSGETLDTQIPSPFPSSIDDSAPGTWREGRSKRVKEWKGWQESAQLKICLASGPSAPIPSSALFPSVELENLRRPRARRRLLSSKASQDPRTWPGSHYSVLIIVAAPLASAFMIAVPTNPTSGQVTQIHWTFTATDPAVFDLFITNSTNHLNLKAIVGKNIESDLGLITYQLRTLPAI
ncbi:hypothetical protein B0H14DRAFT_3148036 [Mycena olivaceomarginata]|nr:hypothetical protein B0H14DRAFT_3148036 [Mycena olivaceomarginata]